MIKKLRQSKLLVIEIFHFKIIVSVVAKKGKEIITLNSVRKISTFPLEAVVQCIDELRAKGTKIPANAICLTTDAFAGIVNLKDGDEEAHSSLQIQWEMENSILPSIPVMTVDQITQSEGFLNKSQLENLYLFEETQGILGETHSQRLLDAEIIDEDKVEEIQYYVDRRPDYNDIDNFDSHLLQEDKVKGRFYSCTATSNQHKLEMSYLLKSQKINLLATLPWSLSLINNDLLKPTVNGLYIEQHPAYWLALQIKKGRISECQIFQGQEQEIPDEIMLLLRDEQFAHCQFISDLHRLSEYKKHLFREEELEETKTQRNALIRTAGVIAWRLPSNYVPAPATVTVPLVPKRQDPKFWWAVAALTCIIFNSAYFVSLFKEKSGLEKRLKLAQQKVEDIESKSSIFKKRKIESDQLILELEKLKKDNVELGTLINQKDPEGFVQELLSVLSKINL
ncbi:MAG: hypothetical protein NE327_14060, partial [Lentisphaeraceae bacterium]|nr:hypothetical protein [Lentisphaeraceae bacterium]